MTYTATLRGYTFGCDQEWDWLPGSAKFEPADYRGQRVAGNGRHGVFAAGGDWAGASRLTFELEHASEDQVTVEEAGQRLRAAFAPHTTDGLLELTLDLPSGAVTVRGRPKPPQIIPDQNHFGYGVARAVFDMCDPLTYSATWRSVTLTAGGTSGGIASPPVSPPTTTGGGAELSDAAVLNAGSAPAHWEATLNGPLTNPRLMLDGQTIQIAGDIPAGSIVAVDSRTGSVLFDGQSRPWVSPTVSTWWLIDPGSSTFSLRSDAGAGTATLRWRDASF